MMIFGLLLCLFITAVMLFGNDLGGKAFGTFLGCMVIVVPVLVVLGIIAAFVLPLVFAALPVLVFFGVIIYIFVRCTSGSKPKSGDGSGMIRMP